MSRVSRGKATWGRESVRSRIAKNQVARFRLSVFVKVFIRYDRDAGQSFKLHRFLGTASACRVVRLTPPQSFQTHAIRLF